MSRRIGVVATHRNGVLGAASSAIRKPLVLFEKQIALLAAFLVVLCIAFTVAVPSFVSVANIVAILAASAVLGLIAIGQSFAIISGGFDLSVQGVVPLVSVLYVVFSNHGIPTSADLILGIAVGGLIGTVNGVVITRVGINPLIATLGMLSIAGGLAYVFSAGTTVVLNNSGAAFLDNNIFAGIPIFVLVTLVFAILAGALLRFTALGRTVYAVGGNRTAAWLAGIRINAVTLFVYSVSGAFAAAAGIVVASELAAGSGTVESAAALDSIAAVIIGGAALTGGEGGVTGTILGVLLLGVISDGLQIMGVSAFYQEIATGGVLLLAVAIQRLRQKGGGSKVQGDDQVQEEGGRGSLEFVHDRSVGWGNVKNGAARLREDVTWTGSHRKLTVNNEEGDTTG